MSTSQLQTARRLITEKRYDEARALLRTMGDDATAQKWLAKLNEIAPETKSFFAEKPMKTARINFLAVLSFILLVAVLGVAIYGILLQPTGITEAQVRDSIQSTMDSQMEALNGTMDGLVSRLDDIESEINGSQSSTVQTWQYLGFQYSQFSDLTSNKSYELASTDNPLYNDFIGSALPCDLSNIFSESTRNCLVQNSHGSTFYLNAFGADGWELISVIDKSTQYTYSVEMILKRAISVIPSSGGLSGLGGINS